MEKKAPILTKPSFIVLCIKPSTRIKASLPKYSEETYENSCNPVRTRLTCPIMHMQIKRRFLWEVYHDQVYLIFCDNNCFSLKNESHQVIGFKPYQINWYYLYWETLVVTSKGRNDLQIMYTQITSARQEIISVSWELYAFYFFCQK